MSSDIRDMVEGYESIGNELNNFLYEGRVKKGIRKEHTKEELEIILESIRKECWEKYSTGAYSLGWTDKH
ncbi:hypothetical protein G9F71_008765 [Clostridium sp. FP2]|uniref:hypothetical protein n=1 Tax=Clostridium sp. FP2 TaxID=2724481 RepID=UPI0013E90178|nr:hypothetical protein [Clostridium sp. FP2]MBZ9622945.1 hypothetical protein [Clostridium sp. FP2]